MDPVFWEPESFFFFYQVPEWINLKTTPLLFHVYSQSVYILWNEDIITARLDPDTTTSRNSNNNMNKQ